jgi:TldD protein
LAPLLSLESLLGFGVEGAGGTFLSPSEALGRELAGSAVQLSDDARWPDGVAAQAYDDEGIETGARALIADGRVAGLLAGREASARAEMEGQAGHMRARAWAEPPCAAPSNLLLSPGEGGDLEALVADTGEGILLDGPSAYARSHDGHDYLAGCELGWRIEQGRKTTRVRAPVYQGGVEALWRSCDAVADASQWRPYGLRWAPGLAVGVGTSPARFRGVHLGSVSRSGEGARSAQG